MIFDLEADGLLDTITKIHCIGLHGDGAYRDIDKALQVLEEAPILIGHNIIGYDIPAIQKLYPDWSPKGLIRDTLVLTRLFWPHIKDSDFRNPKISGKKKGSHSLETWGIRLGNHKWEAPEDWSTWTPEMSEYMMQDVEVTASLWEMVQKEAEKWGLDLFDPLPLPGLDAIQLEHDVAAIGHLVERHGWAFDTQHALKLTGKLSQRRHELYEELQDVFRPKITTTTFTPKANNSRYGYKKGVPVEKTKTEVFNPNSRAQVAERLIDLGWKPSDYTPTGLPSISDDILANLPYVEAKPLAEWFTIEKRLAQISNGKEAWFVHEKNGRIHGRIHTGGAHTGRMTHSNPNVAQVPANDVLYGKECRECWVADEGWTLIGCDAEGLEQRCLAAFLAHWDGGKYRVALLEGDKSQGTDGHSQNAKSIGCSRDEAKVFLYALIYGAGDMKLGQILGGGLKQGRKARASLMRGLPALEKLTKAAQGKITRRGYMIGLDGRRLFTRSKNAALNTLLQSAGAILMKRALVLAYTRLEEKFSFGKDYAIVGLIHDEFQATAPHDLAEEVGETMRQAIIDAGEFYSFKCPLDAQYQTGANWSETH